MVSVNRLIGRPDSPWTYAHAAVAGPVLLAASCAGSADQQHEFLIQYDPGAYVQEAVGPGCSPRESVFTSGAPW